jgi:hypothetical protein
MPQTPMNRSPFANPLLAKAASLARGAPRHVAVIGAGSIGPDIAYSSSPRCRA